MRVRSSLTLQPAPSRFAHSGSRKAPWIAEGDKTVLEAGMTFSCEPGVYDPNWGGFRHSETGIVGKTQGKTLNRYPTRLNDMTISISLKRGESSEARDSPDSCDARAELLLWLRLRRWRLSTAAGTASLTHAAHEFSVFLLLIGSQDGIDLGRCVLTDLLHLGHPVFLRERGIASQLLHLGRFVFQNGTDFLLLVSGQFQHLRQSLHALVDRWRPSPLSAALLSLHLGMKCEASREQRENRNESNVTLVHNPTLPVTRCVSAAARCAVTALNGVCDVRAVTHSETNICSIRAIRGSSQARLTSYCSNTFVRRKFLAIVAGKIMEPFADTARNLKILVRSEVSRRTGLLGVLGEGSVVAAHLRPVAETDVESTGRYDKLTIGRN